MYNKDNLKNISQYFKKSSPEKLRENLKYSEEVGLIKDEIDFQIEKSFELAT